MQGFLSSIPPLQALYYVVAGLTAVGAFYLGIMTFKATRRDKRKDDEDKAETKVIAKQTSAIAQALAAAEQAQLIKSLQTQITALKAELKLVKQRQRRGMGAQFAGALIFLSLLVALFFYEKTINLQIGSANSQAQSANNTANKASKVSDQAVKQANAAARDNKSTPAPHPRSQKKTKPPEETVPPE